VRTGVDVLNAQSDVFRTKNDLSQARYAYIMSRLRLKAAAGTLVEADLVEANNLLVSVSTPDPARP
jgi:outer membrane protein